MDVVVCAAELLKVKGQRVWGKGWLAIAPDGRLADDGKRPYRRWTLHFVHEGVNRVGGLGEGMARNCAGAEAGG